MPDKHKGAAWKIMIQAECSFDPHLQKNCPLFVLDDTGYRCMWISWKEFDEYLCDHTDALAAVKDLTPLP